MVMQKLTPEHYSGIIRALKYLIWFYFYYKQKEINIKSQAYKELADLILGENAGRLKIFVYKLNEDTEIIDCLIFFDMDKQEIFMRSSQRLETAPELMEDAVKSIIEKAKEIGIENLKMYDDVLLLKTISTPPGFFDWIEKKFHITTEQAKDMIISSKVNAYEKNNFVETGEFEFFDIYTEKQQ